MAVTYTVLVTGANAGLGFATCCRLIDEFLATRPQSHNLCLIFITRDQKKSNTTLTKLQSHVKKTISSVYGNTTHDAVSKRQTARITLQGELVDLLSLVSVKQLANKLTASKTHIDALVLNAGIGGWSGISWPRAIWSVLTDVINATTWPAYKIGYTGRTADQKSVRPAQGNDTSLYALLGETFTANVFGHYLLAHWLMPALSASSSSSPAGRIIWISSIEAQAHSFNPSDFQALASNASYESSKRLTDILVLTSEDPSTAPFVNTYLSPTLSTSTLTAPSSSSSPENKVRFFVAHPGICATSIAALPLPLHYAMICVFYIARWLGSPWHPISSYVGAVAGVWLALAPVGVLADLEPVDSLGSRRQEEKVDGGRLDEGGDDERRAGGKSKWGSSTDRVGRERVLRTEVAGWGWTGRVGEEADGGMKILAGRHRNATALTAEQKQEFLQLGRSCWEEMEVLRTYWEKRL